jgi:hypothetical protein
VQEIANNVLSLKFKVKCPKFQPEKASFEECGRKKIKKRKAEAMSIK